MSVFFLELDTESINKENEDHNNNFHFKVKNLAEHCVDYIEGKQSKNDCNSQKFNKDIHDQIDPPKSKKFRTKIINHFFKINDKELNATATF